MGRKGRRPIQALQAQQMATIVHNGNGHSPLIFQGFRLSSGGNQFDVRRLKNMLCFHGVYTYQLNNRARA
jgi:hypothetical protein